MEENTVEHGSDNGDAVATGYAIRLKYVHLVSNKLNKIDAVKAMLEVQKLYSNIEYYVMAQHEAPETGHEHVHIFIVFKKTQQIGKQFLMAMCYPHIVAKYYQNAAKNAMSYVLDAKKASKIIEYGIKPSFIDEESKAEKNKRLLTEDLVDLVDKGDISAYSLPLLKKAREIYSGLKKRKIAMENVRGKWIYGKPGLGKTHFCVQDSLDRNEDEPYFKECTHKWWDGFHGQKCVIMDDLSQTKAFPELPVCLKLWADKFVSQGQTKGGMVQLDYEILYVTSNYSIDEVFKSCDEVTIEAIKRRFTEVEFTRSFREIEKDIIAHDILNKLFNDLHFNY